MGKHLLLLILLVSLGCSQAPLKAQRSQASQAGADSTTVSESAAGASADRPAVQAQEWVLHPCRGVSGAPYRKYEAFLWVAETSTLMGRESASKPGKSISTPAKSVDEFFKLVGIQKFCEGQASSGGSPGQSQDQDQDQGGKGDYDPGKQPAFRTPLNENIEFYYGPVKSVAATEPAAKHTLKRALHRLLASPHIQKSGVEDRLVEQCPESLPEGESCLQQRVFTYSGVRKVMFGDIDLQEGKEAGTYEVYDYYCQQWRGKADFEKRTKDAKFLPGPGNIVFHEVVNVEHTWPQSKFPDPKGSAMNLMEKTDLHHIFPTDTKVNAIRGNFDFAEVEESGVSRMSCSDGKKGTAKSIDGLPGGYVAFEPPTEHKGDVARALFYFSTRYNVGMPEAQERFLRKWNIEDPPDRLEIERSRKVYLQNGIRNPFIDHNEWVERVDRFCKLELSDKQLATKEDCRN